MNICTEGRMNEHQKPNDKTCEESKPTTNPSASKIQTKDPGHGPNSPSVRRRGAQVEPTNQGESHRIGRPGADVMEKEEEEGFPQMGFPTIICGFVWKWFRTSAKNENENKKGSQREPKGNQSDKMEPKGAKREPKIKNIIKNHTLERSKFSSFFHQVFFFKIVKTVMAHL